MSEEHTPVTPEPTPPPVTEPYEEGEMGEPEEDEPPDAAR